MVLNKIFAPALLFALGGCFGPNLDFGEEPTTFRYTEASASGLNAVRPYPTAEDVCQVIRENQEIRDPVDDGSFLIACPKHERGAISDRQNEGAQVVAQARHWTILSVPAR
ncbi:hypothetical protein [Ruegeria halocynthiae]|uniref:hypothetical protein n=1 Tax=Ruegeria halocynthiae TaxID=985054 RepID=UPI001269759C|nr:hypothetical protein [Ruegeria halocynthiae]